MAYQQYYGRNVYPGLMPTPNFATPTPPVPNYSTPTPPVPNYSTLPPGNAAFPQPEVGFTASPMLSPAIVCVEKNPVTLCKMGQDTVREMCYQLTALFEKLEIVRPPSGYAIRPEEALSKWNILTELRAEVRRMHCVREIYKNLNEATEKMEISFPTVESLVPLDEWDGKYEELKKSDMYCALVAERAALQEKVSVVNREIKEALDLERRAIWEIDCHLSMVRC